jgi:hypothetical protein
MPASTVTSATSTKRHSIATMPHPGTIENLNVGKTIARRRTTISTDSKSIFVRFIQRKERRCGKAERHALPNYIREHRIDFKCTEGMVNVPKDPEEPKDERVIQRKPLAAKRGPVMLSLWTDIDMGSSSPESAELRPRSGWMRRFETEMRSPIFGSRRAVHIDARLPDDREDEREGNVKGSDKSGQPKKEERRREGNKKELNSEKFQGGFRR